jgi:TRAP-type mannitol/chloroaromatic compound transport system permease small subunit
MPIRTNLNHFGGRTNSTSSGTRTLITGHGYQTVLKDCYSIDVSVNGYSHAHVFNRPTLWAWDVNIQLLAFMATLGGGYVLLNDEHVRVDILVAKFSRRKRAILESFTGILTIVALGILTWYLSDVAVTSVKYLEVHWSTFAPPVYPLRILMAFGSLMFFLQAIAVFLQNILISFGREPDMEVEPN